ncbi:MAG: hypothetical protein BGO28_03360 [Alphaproteobacteria bacterium 43-37]|nr:MAG: hypothetical protein BGO28_03360 [Alphaproteobacteria bacterium 43-37]
MRTHPEAQCYGFALLVAGIIKLWLPLTILQSLTIMFLSILTCQDTQKTMVSAKDAILTSLLLTFHIPHDRIGNTIWIGIALILLMLTFKDRFTRFIGNVDVILFGLCLSTLPIHHFPSFFVATGVGMLAIFVMTRERRIPFILPLWASYVGHLSLC